MAEDVAQLPVKEDLDISTEESQAPTTAEIEDRVPASMDVEDPEAIEEPVDNISNNAETGEPDLQVFIFFFIKVQLLFSI